jgi:6-phosphogluconolactonase
MKQTELRWHSYATPEQVVNAVTSSIATQAARSMAARDAFLIVLSGGDTPQPIHTALTLLDTQWRQWHVYFADERCLPRNDVRRNDVAARRAWLDRVPIPPEQIHAIPAELGPDGATEAYRRTLAGLGDFDFVMLGLGQDGHTASLFPGQPGGWEADAPDVLAVHNSPHPPAERVSLSAARLARARSVAVVVTGAGKRGAVARLAANDAIPLCAVRPAGGMDIYLDETVDPAATRAGRHPLRSG